MNVMTVPKASVLAARLSALLVREGFVESEIMRRAREMIANVHPILDASDCQKDLECHVGRPFDAEPPVLDARFALQYLPALMMAPFPVDALSFVRMCAGVPGCYDRVKPALRYYELWAAGVQQAGIEDVLEKFAQGERGWCSHAFALYAHKLGDLGKSFRDGLFESIAASGAILPVLSSVPYEQIPDPCTDIAQQVVELANEHSVSERVVPVTHVDYYAGICLGLEEGFDKSMCDTQSEWYGHYVTVNVDSIPVGRMKMLGDHSLIGLRNVFTLGNRLACTRGGVYATSQQIVDKAVFEYNVQGPRAEINVAALPLFPLRMVGIDYGFEQTKCIVFNMDW